MAAGTTLVPLRWESAHLSPLRPLPPREAGVRRITILHTNDFHSNVDGRVGTDGQFRGGLARIAATIRRAQAHGPTLVLDAGDMAFGSGTWWDAGGAAAVARLRSQAGYQLAAIGNHDLEHGLEGLREMLAADHDFVAANLTLSDADLSARVHPAMIASLNGFRLGITGITTEETLTLIPRARLAGIGILPPLASVGAVVREVAPLVDAVIIISHLGLDRGQPGDRELAQHLAGGKLAAVVGGHTHAAHEPAPLVGGALLCNAGAFGANVGELTLDRSLDGVVQAAERLIPQMPSSPEDPALLAARNAEVEALMPLQREYRALPRLPELPRPDYELTLLACALPWSEPALPALLMLPRMYVAAALPQRRWVSRAELYTSFPSRETLVQATLAGGNLRQMLGAQGELLSYARAHAKWIGSGQPVELESIDPSASYSVTTSELVAEGGLGWHAFPTAAQNIRGRHTALATLLGAFPVDEAQPV